VAEEDRRRTERYLWNCVNLRTGEGGTGKGFIDILGDQRSFFGLRTNGRAKYPHRLVDISDMSGLSEGAGKKTAKMTSIGRDDLLEFLRSSPSDMVGSNGWRDEPGPLWARDDATGGTGEGAGAKE